MNVAAGWLSAALWRRLRRCYSVLLMLAIWEGAARSGLVNSFLLPAASDVLANLWRMVTEGQLLYHALESLMRASAGLGLALVIGIPLGLIRARSRLANSILDPILTFWFPVPKVAPVFRRWAGACPAPPPSCLVRIRQSRPRESIPGLFGIVCFHCAGDLHRRKRLTGFCRSSCR
jgi:ABC-type nitrate/sulfonate/bicarbonate transport system permease component